MPTLEGAQHHALRIGHIQRAVQSGQMHPHDGAIQIARSQAVIDRHAQAKHDAAMRASIPKMARGFGSLSDGTDDPNMSGLLSSGGPSDIGAANAGDTDRSPLQQRTSGGFSQVPNASSNPSRRRGPGY
jgi:hypothetical protein